MIWNDLSMTQSDLMAKIRKLTALAGSPNLHEAALAAGEVARLLAKLATQIGTALHVSVLAHPGSNRLTVTGRGPDVATMCTLYHSARSQLLTARDRAWSSAAHVCSKIRFTTTFMVAAGAEIEARMMAGRAQAAQEVGAGALVKLDDYQARAREAIAKHRAANGTKVKTVQTSYRSAGDTAQEAGRYAGRTVDLNPSRRALRGEI